MPASLPPCLRRVARFARLLALVLALAAQISAGVAATPDAASASPAARLAAAMVLCNGVNHTGKNGNAPVHHHLPDLLIATNLHHAAQQAAAPDPAGVPPRPSARPAFWPVQPEATGPPARYAAAAYPTGPPTFLI